MSSLRSRGRFKAAAGGWRRVARLALMLGLASAISLEAESPKDHAGWWAAAYGVLDKKSEPLVGRAEEIFARVAVAADEKGNRLPQLLVVNTPGDPFAVALPDGTIVLTRGALEFCYRQAAEKDRRLLAARGDVRLAFVIGHELAHLSRDDFWHAAAFGAAQRIGLPAQATAEIRSLLQPSPRDARLAELQADATGAIYMAMAGFSPVELLEKDPDFFVRWSQQAGLGETLDDPGHPSPEQRAVLLRAQLADLVNDLDFFYFGVRLAQLGRYRDSIRLLERFSDRFPGREVFTDLGYAHYQLALRLLSRCDGESVMRLRLPVAIDDETLAGRGRLRGSEGRETCLAAKGVREQLDEARSCLQKAVELDGKHMPARHLLLAVEITSGRAGEAFDDAKDSLQGAPNDGASLNAKGVALYLLGSEQSKDMVDKALALLESAKADPRVAADVAFNQGMLLSERGRAAAARAAWERFLTLEPRGQHADLVRERLNLRPPAPPAQAARRSPVPAPPVPLGPVSANVGALLSRMERRSFEIRPLRGEIDPLRGAFYRGAGLQALQLGNSIEIVEQQLGPGALPAGLTLGDAPLATVVTPGGRLLRYPSYAIDYKGMRPVNLLFFAQAAR